MFSRGSRIVNSAVQEIIRRNVRTTPAVQPTSQQAPIPTTSLMPDQLFSSIEIEYRGHDPAVLKSYTSFLENVCTHLDIKRGKTEVQPYVKWIQPLLRSKFVHKKYKLHYETRTHITRFEVKNLTGSTASTFLEYIQRNIPEGVGMRIGYTEHKLFPDTLRT